MKPLARFGSLDLQFLRKSRRICSKNSHRKRSSSRLAPLQECFRGHRFMKGTAVTASTTLPRASFNECDRSHRFKNVTRVTASRRLQQLPLQECYRSHRFENVTAVTASRM